MKNIKLNLHLHNFMGSKKIRRIESKMKTIWPICLVFIGLALLGLARPSPQEKNFGICADCHEEVCADFKLMRHANIEIGAWTSVAKKAETICSNCHGDTTKHLEEGGGRGTIFAFKKTDDTQAKTQKCLSCHGETRTRFFASPHGKVSMDCTNCHGELMKMTSEKKTISEICISCHEEISAQFKLNERHRLKEEILECITCHDPHAPSTKERLGGFKHESCLRCHTDKGGPFLYEHGASRIEGCTACHEVHGTPNRHMLTHQSVSDLCFSCHAASPAWHRSFSSEGTNCTVCHSTIHGSNLSKIFLK